MPLKVISEFLETDFNDTPFNLGVDKTGTIYGLYDYEYGNNLIFDLKDDEDCKEIISTLKYVMEEIA